MKKAVSSSITFLLLFIIIIASSSLAQPPPSSSAYNEEIIPDAIAVPSGNLVHLGVQAVGVQHYSFNGSSWVLVNATAQLFHLNTIVIVGEHFYLPQKDSNGGQPTWISTLDSTSVTAKALSTTTLNPNAIPWTLLQATTTTTSTNKDSYFGAVTYVQRIKPEGGLEPLHLGTNVGDVFFSPYTAIYLFYT